MPQMSPMLWFHLFLYFLFSYLLILMMINNLIYYKNLNLNKIEIKKLNFKMKW